MSLFLWWARRLPLPRRRNDPIRSADGRRVGTTSYVPNIMRNSDTEMPWIVYLYGRTVDDFWPPWRSTRILGCAAIECECAVCGAREVVAGPIPRFGPVNPEGRQHPDRIRFKLAHLHRDRGPQMTWARPLLNPMAAGGLDLDALAMRLEADLMAAES